MDIVLLSLTGLGNGLLSKLKNLGHRVLVVATREEIGKYPYFSCNNLVYDCAEKNQEYVFIPRKGKWVHLLDSYLSKADLVLSGTFHRIVPVEYIKDIKYGLYNIHLSLLPKHKGPSPVFWARELGDKEYGFTVHEMTNKVDEGKIIFQKKLILDNASTLGYSLNKLYSYIVSYLPDIIEAIYNPIEIFPPYESTYEGRPPTLKVQNEN